MCNWFQVQSPKHRSDNGPSKIQNKYFVRCIENENMASMAYARSLNPVNYFNPAEPRHR